MSSAVSAPALAGRHDPGVRRKATRGGRQRGCFIYISAEQLRALGFGPDDPPPFYRTWESSDGRPRVVVNLYREP